MRETATCHECDLTVMVTALGHGHKACCPRCGYTITRKLHNASLEMAVYSITAVIALLFANLFTFIGLSAQGQERSLTLVQSVQILFSEGQVALAIVILMAIIVLPLLFAICLNLLLFDLAFGRATVRSFLLLRAIKAFQFWNMAEIYLLGILVSIVKVASLADIHLGPSIWFFSAFCIAQLAAMQRLDCYQLSGNIRTQIRQSLNICDDEQDQASLSSSCHHCGTGLPHSLKECHFCGSEVLHRKRDSLQRTWLFLVTGILLYIPANLMPIMYTTTLGQSEPSTIVGGVLLLWEHGSYPIATIIFVASIAVPIGKFLVLLALLASVQLHLLIRPEAQIAAYRITEFIGRWSMVDVFVVAFLAGLIQMGNLMAILPGPAVIAFAAMVVATMLAADSLEPKLFWDKHGQQ